MDYIEVAKSIVRARFPEALAAVLAGSTVNGVPTATSDLDIVVVLAGAPAPYRETIIDDGRPVELFVHTEASLAYWYERERSEARATLAHMLATGVPLLGARTVELQESARTHLDAGPARWTSDQIDYRRYALTDALDDLADAIDPDERDAIAGQVLTMVAEMALHNRGAWVGRGKWLVRQLRAADPDLARELMSAHRAAVASGSVASLITVAGRRLDEIGGPLTDGYTAR
jgi:hypothetical protein